MGGRGCRAPVFPPSSKIVLIPRGKKPLKKWGRACVYVRVTATSSWASTVIRSDACSNVTHPERRSDFGRAGDRSDGGRSSVIRLTVFLRVAPCQRASHREITSSS